MVPPAAALALVAPHTFPCQQKAPRPFSYQGYASLPMCASAHLCQRRCCCVCQCVVCLCARESACARVCCVHAWPPTCVSVHKLTSAQITFAYVRVCMCVRAEAPPGQGSPSLLLLLPWISPSQTAPPSRQLEANITCIFPEIAKG